MAVRELRHPATGEDLRAETGTGRIIELEDRSRNAKVTISSDDPQVNIPLVSYVEKVGPVWARVQQAYQGGFTIWYRIDVHRRSKVDPSLPLKSLTSNQKVRDLVDLTRPNDAPDQLLIGGVPALPGGAYSTAGPVAPPGAQQQVEDAWGSVMAGAARQRQNVGHPTEHRGGEFAGAQADPWSTVASGPDAPPQRTPQQERAMRSPWSGTGQPAPKPGPPPGYQQPDPQQQHTQQTRRQARQHAQQEARVGNGNRPNTQAVDEAVRAVYELAANLAVNGGSQDLLDELSDQALAAGASRQVILNAREQGGNEGTERAQRQAASRAAVQRQRDPDRVGERAPQPPDMHEQPSQQGGHPQGQGQGSGRGAGQQRPGQMGARSGFSQRPIANDERPWMPKNSDGRPNLSSYAAGGVMEFVALAGKLRVDRTRGRHEEDPSVSLDPPTEQQVFQLAKHLLHLADTIQHHGRGGGRVDRNVASHKLARQAVREALHVYPIPWGADTNGMAEWSQQMIGHGTSLMNVTWRLFVGDDAEQRSDHVQGSSGPGGRGGGGDRPQDR